MRPAESYRGARRNKCLREEKSVWGPNWYWIGHMREEKSVWGQNWKSVLGVAPAQAAPQKPLRIRREGRGQ